jgi:hypothetical protein
MSEQMRESQVSVPMPPSLRSWVETRAKLEDRSVASVVRRCVEAVAADSSAAEPAPSGPFGTSRSEPPSAEPAHASHRGKR